MALLRSPPAAVLVITGLVTLMPGPTPLDVVLVSAGMPVGPGGVSGLASWMA